MGRDAVLAHDLVADAALPAPLGSGVTFNVAAGDRLALVGANGAGKTTLLRLLAGAGPPPAGRLRLFGHDTATLDADARAAVRRRIGAAFATETFVEHASAADNLALPLLAHGEEAATAGVVVAELLDWLGLGAAADVAAGDLSTGERRRLALGRAAIARPDLLLLDEPLDGLDAGAIGRAAQLLREFAGFGCAVLVATARLEVARSLGCESVALADGRLRATTSPLRAVS